MSLKGVVNDGIDGNRPSKIKNRFSFGEVGLFWPP